MHASWCDGRGEGLLEPVFSLHPLTMQAGPSTVCRPLESPPPSSMRAGTRTHHPVDVYREAACAGYHSSGLQVRRVRSWLKLVFQCRGRTAPAAGFRSRCLLEQRRRQQRALWQGEVHWTGPAQAQFPPPASPRSGTWACPAQAQLPMLPGIGPQDQPRPPEVGCAAGL